MHSLSICVPHYTTWGVDCPEESPRNFSVPETSLPEEPEVLHGFVLDVILWI